VIVVDGMGEEPPQLRLCLSSMWAFRPWQPCDRQCAGRPGYEGQSATIVYGIRTGAVAKAIAMGRCCIVGQGIPAALAATVRPISRTVPTIQPWRTTLHSSTALATVTTAIPGSVLLVTTQDEIWKTA